VRCGVTIDGALAFQDNFGIAVEVGSASGQGTSDPRSCIEGTPSRTMPARYLNAAGLGPDRGRLSQDGRRRA
jgi:hypothetical protein